MIITISGQPGSGKSTVAKMLAAHLGYTHYSMGGIRRGAAKAHGMTLEEWNTKGETDPTTDTQVDTWFAEFAKTHDNLVVDGRLAWYFAPQAFKVFLTVDPTTGAQRILNDVLAGARPEENVAKTLEEMQKHTQQRMESDVKRYQSIYGVVWDNQKAHDFILDTSHLNAEQTFQAIIDKLPKMP